MRYTFVGDGLQGVHPLCDALNSVYGDDNVIFLDSSQSPQDAVRQAIPVKKVDGKNTADFSQATIVVCDDCPDTTMGMMGKLKANKSKQGLTVHLGWSVPDADDVNAVLENGTNDVVRDWVATGQWPDVPEVEDDPFSSEDLFGDPEDDFGFGDTAEPEAAPKVTVSTPVNIDGADGDEEGSEDDGWGFDGVSVEPDAEVLPSGGQTVTHVDEQDEGQDEEDFVLPPAVNLSPAAQDDDLISDEDMESVDTGSDVSRDDIEVEMIPVDRDIKAVDVLKTETFRESGATGPSREGTRGTLGVDNTLVGEGDLETDLDLHQENPPREEGDDTDDVTNITGVNPGQVQKITHEDRELDSELIDVDAGSSSEFQGRHNPDARRRISVESHTDVDASLVDPGLTEVDTPENNAPYLQRLSPEDRRRQQDMRVEDSLGSSYMRAGTADNEKSRIYYITGLSGGVGKTTVSHTMAGFTAKAVQYLRDNDSYDGRQTIYLIEFDWENSKLADILETSNTIQHMAEAIGNLDSGTGKIDSDFIRRHLDQCTVISQEGLHVIPAPYRPGWAAESPEKFRNLIKAYMTIIQYLMRDPSGSLIFVDAPTLVPPSRDPLAKNLFGKFNPYVTVVSTVGQARLTIRAADMLTMPIDGKKTSSKGKTVTRSGYGVEESSISVVLNKVPNTAEAKEKFEEYRDESYFDVSGVIPDIDSLKTRFVGDAFGRDKHQIQKNAGKYLAKIGFPEFTTLLKSPESSAKQNVKRRKGFGLFRKKSR